MICELLNQALQYRVVSAPHLGCAIFVKTHVSAILVHICNAYVSESIVYISKMCGSKIYRQSLYAKEGGKGSIVKFLSGIALFANPSEGS